MGSVYLADQTDINREVAIKVLLPELVSSEDDRLRFVQELRTLQTLSEDHIMRFYSAAISDEGIPYAVCEYLDGKTLRQTLNEIDTIPFERTLNLLKQIAIAMQAAHAHDIIHRDLKPENIILLQAPEPDFVKILDFGLSKIIGQQQPAQKLTQTGALLGTVNYMSPEQCSGRAADKRSDIYSMGCIAFECITGKKLFESDSPIGVIHKHISESCKDSLQRLRFSCPPRFIEIVEKMLEKSPEKRYQTIQELLEDLNSLEQKTSSQKNRPLSSGLLFIPATVGLIACVLFFVFMHNSAQEDIPKDAREILNGSKTLIRNNRNQEAIKEITDWLKSHPQANSYTRGESQLLLISACNNLEEKLTHYKLAISAFKERSGEVSRENILRTLEAGKDFFNLLSTENVKEFLDEALIAFEPHTKLTSLQPEVLRLSTKLKNSSKFLNVGNRYLASLAETNRISADLIKLHLYVGDLNVIAENGEEAERHYRKAQKLCERLPHHEVDNSNEINSHLQRRLLLLHPDGSYQQSYFFCKKLTQDSNYEKRAWSAAYIMWGSAMDSNDGSLEELYANLLNKMRIPTPIHVFLAFCFSGDYVRVIRHNPDLAPTLMSYLLTKLPEPTSPGHMQEFFLVYNLSEEARTSGNKKTIALTDRLLLPYETSVHQMFDEEAYRALVNPSTSKAKSIIAGNLNWEKLPLWTGLIAESATDRLEPTIVACKTAQEVNDLSELKVSTQKLSQLYATEFKALVFWHYARSLFKGRNYKQAAEYYKKCIEVLDETPEDFSDTALSYDNSNWFKLRAKLNLLACKRRLKI